MENPMLRSDLDSSFFPSFVSSSLPERMTTISEGAKSSGSHTKACSCGDILLNLCRSPYRFACQSEQRGAGATTRKGQELLNCRANLGPTDKNSLFQNKTGPMSEVLMRFRAQFSSFASGIFGLFNLYSWDPRCLSQFLAISHLEIFRSQYVKSKAVHFFWELCLGPFTIPKQATCNTSFYAFFDTKNQATPK